MRIDRMKFVAELAKRDFTLKKLSELSGVSRQTLSYIKQGKSCTDEVGHAIADALKLNVNDLIENQ